VKTIIHVNGALIRYNAVTGSELPTYTVKRGGTTTYGFGVEIKGPSKLVDTRTSGQLSCGARAWIETDAPVVIEGAMSWRKVMELKRARS
jgi:hypothetical protein